MDSRRFGELAGRQPDDGDADFLFALYLSTRPDVQALPVPRSVIEGIARHQQRLQTDDYARRFPSAQSWLVEQDGLPVARIVLDWQPDVLRIVDLAVAGAARRRGIAARLLAALQEECSGRRPIALRVLAANGAARALYEAAGFARDRNAGDGGAALELRWNYVGPEAVQNE